MKKLSIILFSIILSLSFSNTYACKTCGCQDSKQKVLEENVDMPKCEKTGEICPKTCAKKEKGTCCQSKKSKSSCSKSNEKSSCSKSSEKSSCSKSNKDGFNFNKSNNYAGKKTCSKTKSKSCCKSKKTAKDKELELSDEKTEENAESTEK